MKISGFTMGKNVQKLYYPIKQSIQSILPIVDEFIVALGDSEADDNTLQAIQSIGSDKIKIVNTVWDIEKYPRGMENAHQTDIAKSYCSGDWLFYLQADEVIHEKYLPVIQNRCAELLNDQSVEGLLFRYKHFWGDYWHYHNSHGWYRDEIRIIRNRPEIHSWVSAQSFRRIPEFDGLNYRVKEGTFKLNVARVDAEVYHYGWVRPPEMMRKKTKSLSTIHKGVQTVEEMEKRKEFDFDYGPLNKIPEFKDTHPKVMEDWIAKFDWRDQLQYSGNVNKNRPLSKHEKTKYRIITFIEQTILGGMAIAEPHNYKLLNR